jgi:hypothetical protein
VSVAYAEKLPDDSSTPIRWCGTRNTS